MSVIIGKCPHGVVVVAMMELPEYEDDLREITATYDIERVDKAIMGGECSSCRERYLNNCKMLGIEF